MKDKKQKVLIVGAGLAGLALYRALDKSRFDIDIIEKRKAFKRLGYVISFTPTGVAALKVLGYSMSDIEKLGRAVQENHLRNAKGETASKTDFRPWATEFGSTIMMIDRRSLYKLLEDEMPTNSIQFGISPTLLEQQGNKVSVHFNDGSTVEYDFVIGADGVHSFVREAILPGVQLKNTGTTGVWTWLPRSENYTRQAGGYVEEGSWVLFFDTSDKERICIFFGIPNKYVPENIKSGDYVSFLQDHFKNFANSVPEIIRNLPAGEEMYMHRDFEIDAQTWHRNSVGVLGDAAHARSVLTGFGSGLAIEDAVVLADFLRKEESFDDAFEQFEKQQKTRVEMLALDNLLKTKEVGKILHDFFASSLLFK